MQFFCVVYYVCSYVQVVPQLTKLVQTKSSNDYSFWQVFLRMLGTICWSIYIFTSVQGIVVYIGTIIDLILTALVTILILKYYSFKTISKKEG